MINPNLLNSNTDFISYNSKAASSNWAQSDLVNAEIGLRECTVCELIKRVPKGSNFQLL